MKITKPDKKRKINTQEKSINGQDMLSQCPVKSSLIKLDNIKTQSIAMIFFKHSHTHIHTYTDTNRHTHTHTMHTHGC